MDDVISVLAGFIQQEEVGEGWGVTYQSPVGSSEEGSLELS